ncbi:dTDP-4-dehydrorhamnose reductase [Corynebacterium sp. TAE3-ERU12]|uniref:dTDP-4-dehydrorhamnose reductase n=1 Tax=Corynebacterium sp. TAE3-ERU12 TaxID=2849491 RepID=UPI001C45F6A3|nr:dTDP-4-dehydrorhamnose reductase [Corynebacterium sp. TAE3-ERU12]MBV7294804.1 dTDP-4-dehydrorhamnose reductase [Corynebacterium sp. TAE3-ERU12]
MPHPGVLCVGAGGQLGSALTARGVRGLGRAELDITDRAAVMAHPDLGSADVVINCAAFTAVDDAESHPQAAAAVNEAGAGYLAQACAASGAFLIHISTDYVFDGQVLADGTARPWSTTDTPAPRTVYGRTKLAGERAVQQVCPRSAIVRTAWLYDGRTPDFVTTMRRLEATQDTIRVVDDQYGCPTFVGDLADALIALAKRPTPGLFHLTNSGVTTWCGLAREVFELVGADPQRVVPCTTEEFPRPAPRPQWSALDGSAWVAAGYEGLPEWRDGLRRALL